MATARSAGPASGTGGDLGAGGDVGGHRPGISSAPPTQATAASDEAAARIARLRASPLRAVLGEVGARVLRPGTLLPLPVAHGEGRFTSLKKDALATLEELATHRGALEGGKGAYWVARTHQQLGDADAASAAADDRGHRVVDRRHRQPHRPPSDRSLRGQRHPDVATPEALILGLGDELRNAFWNALAELGVEVE